MKNPLALVAKKVLSWIFRTSKPVLNVWVPRVWVSASLTWNTLKSRVFGKNWSAPKPTKPLISKRGETNPFCPRMEVGARPYENRNWLVVLGLNKYVSLSDTSFPIEVKSVSKLGSVFSAGKSSRKWLWLCK